MCNKGGTRPVSATKMKILVGEAVINVTGEVEPISLLFAAASGKAVFYIKKWEYFGLVAQLHTVW